MAVAVGRVGVGRRTQTDHRRIDRSRGGEHELCRKLYILRAFSGGNVSLDGDDVSKIRNSSWQLFTIVAQKCKMLL